MFTSHALNEDLGVLVNENVWLGLLGVNTSRHNIEHVSLGSAEYSGQHFYFKVR